MNCTHLIHDDSPVDGVGDDALDERYTVLEFQNADLLKPKKINSRFLRSRFVSI